MTSFSATLNGTLDPHGSSTTLYFQYGTTTSYGSTTGSQTKSGNTYQVVFNPEGKAETLRFESINAMLLNEFLKEHRRVQEQDAIEVERGKAGSNACRGPTEGGRRAPRNESAVADFNCASPHRKPP